ncbi:MAG: NUDIX domain-containing protein [Actinomycetota bacterium]|nr:NUDIX domain-containing protein [Actinomycetota bacterium]
MRLRALRALGACRAAVVVDDAERMLLARRAHDPDAGRWDTLGGFLDEGEHPLDGLRRELLEETGAEVEPSEFIGAYLDTYGDGPDATSVLNLVWEARIVSGKPTRGGRRRGASLVPPQRASATRGMRLPVGHDVPDLPRRRVVRNTEGPEYRPFG